MPRETQMAQFLKQILYALHYMHSKGSSHKEISPMNMLCVEDAQQ